MQARSAVILSLGMIHKKVDTNPFIIELLKKAKEKDSKFVFTNELRDKAFKLSQEEFNEAQIEPEVFREKLTSLLGITMEKEEFWKEWNAMIDIGDVAGKIESLKAWAGQNNALLYLNTDTNVVHLEKMGSIYKEKKISSDFSKNPALLSGIPLYASCLLKKSRYDLIKEMHAKIKEKESKEKESKIQKMLLILGDPENIKNEAHRAIAKKEVDTISAWCKENGISIYLHKNEKTLEETLTEAVNPIQSVEKNEESYRLAVSQG